jgi:Zn-dependent protease with chaperone function
MRDAKSDRAAPRARHYGLWWAVLAFPMMLASLALIVMLSGGLGRWAPAVPLAWLLVAPVWLTRAGERAAIRVGLGYRAVRAGERALLEPVASTAAKRCRLDDGACDFYVQPHAHTINAYASGRRSIAVSTGLVSALEQGRLTRDQAVAILAHEIGHLRDHSTRYGLVTAWLTAPWRAAVFILGGLLRLIVRAVPTAKAALVLVPVLLVMAGMQSAQHHAWAPLAVLTVLAVLLSVLPVADAALSRASELAADKYAVSVGSGSDLASALAIVPRSPRAASGSLCGSHPSVEVRIACLTGMSPMPRSRRWSLMWVAIGI